MHQAERSTTGIRLGLIVLCGVTFGFLGLFLFGPERAEPPPANDVNEARSDLLTVLDDPATRGAVESLKAAAPATFSQLDATAKLAIATGESEQRLSQLLLEALFSQFQGQAYYLQYADSAAYQDIMAGLADGLRQLDAYGSAWCDGNRIAAFLSQNEQDLVPSLLAEFPYQSPQYDWVMGWMETVLTIAKTAQDRPRQYARPNFNDEAILQQQGLALGSEQWGVALQVAAFANSEGVSYDKMQEVISGMDVCALGIAVESVSDRLPSDVRGRIWADLMPEIMMGNTPYVMWRVTDYFFIN